MCEYQSRNYIVVQYQSVILKGQLQNCLGVRLDERKIAYSKAMKQYGLRERQALRESCQVVS